jgi:hypothetical protein
MFGGHIPGMTKRDAEEWADETPSFKKLPERAPAEKGKPTLRSKKASKGDLIIHMRPPMSAGDRVSHLAAGGALGAGGTYLAMRGKKKGRNKHAEGEEGSDPSESEAGAAFVPSGDYESVEDPKKKKKKRKKVASAFAQLEGALGQAFKLAALGTSVMNPSNVGRLRGMMTTHSLKAPGYAASTQAIKPTRSVVAAMNVNKPH